MLARAESTLPAGDYAFDVKLARITSDCLDGLIYRLQASGMYWYVICPFLAPAQIVLLVFLHQDEEGSACSPRSTKARREESPSGLLSSPGLRRSG
jgi:hypothetical protein